MSMGYWCRLVTVEPHQSRTSERPFILVRSTGSANLREDFDEVAIFNRSLSEYEIFTMWNQSLTGTEEGLIGLWNFNDGAVTDSTPYGRNGELR